MLPTILSLHTSATKSHFLITRVQSQRSADPRFPCTRRTYIWGGEPKSETRGKRARKGATVEGGQVKEARVRAREGRERTRDDGEVRERDRAREIATSRALMHALSHPRTW